MLPAALPHTAHCSGTSHLTRAGRVTGYRESGIAPQHLEAHTVRTCTSAPISFFKGPVPHLRTSGTVPKTIKALLKNLVRT